GEEQQDAGLVDRDAHPPDGYPQGPEMLLLRRDPRRVRDLHRLGHVGPDAVDAHAVDADLYREALREVDDGRLEGAVDGLGRVAAQPLDRRDVDDRPAP